MGRHNKFGDTLLHLMCTHGAPEEDIRLALEFGADPHERCSIFSDKDDIMPEYTHR